MPDTMRGWTATDGGLLFSQYATVTVNQMRPFWNSNDNSVVSFPEKLRTAAGIVANEWPMVWDTSSPFGLRVEKFGATNPADLRPAGKVLADFTYTSLPHGSTSQSFSGPFRTSSQPILDTVTNTVWIIHSWDVSHSYFIPFVGGYYNRYFKFSCTRYFLNSYTYSHTDFSGQWDYDEFLGDTGGFRGGTSYRTDRFIAYSTGKIYCGTGDFNVGTNGWNFLIINTATVGLTIKDDQPAPGSSDFYNYMVTDGSDDMYGPANSDILKITRSSETLSYSTMGLTISGTVTNGILGSDGRIFFAPDSAVGVMIINPSAGTAQYNSLGIYSGGITKARWIAKGPDNLLYVFPFRNSSWPNIIRFNPSTTVGVQLLDGFYFTSGWGVTTLGGYISNDFNFFLPGFNRNWTIGGFKEPTGPIAPDYQTVQFATGDETVHAKVTPGLRPPFLLYDFRNYDGDFVIHNEGTGGDEWDLNVYTKNWFTNNFFIGGYKGWMKEVWNHNHIGGHPTGLPFTFMLALGSFDEDTAGDGDDSSTYIETANLPFSIFVSTNERWDASTSLYEINHFSTIADRQYNNYNELTVYETAPGLGAASPYNSMKERLVTHTIDFSNLNAAMWVDSTRVPVGTNTGTATNPNQRWVDPTGTVEARNYIGYTPIAVTARDWLIHMGNVNNRVYWYGFDATTDNPKAMTFPHIGKITNCKGMAIFRGEPSPEDLTYWKGYWYP